MESSFDKVQKNLIAKDLLLKRATYLEALASQKRKEANQESFSQDISLLQNELLAIVNEYHKYETLLNGAMQQYMLESNGSLFPSEVSFDFYTTYSFDGIPLKSICDTLVSKSARILEILELLRSVCGTLGHHFKYVRTDEIFDFESLECTFEEHDIYYCTCCGKLKLFDVSNDIKNGMDKGEAERLKQIRFLESFEPFTPPFCVVGAPNQQNINGIDVIKR